jgi:serine/threonine protein kinase
VASLPSHVGKYEIVRRLGYGGMGTIYLARDPHLGRLVALKVSRVLQADDELRERFLREGRAIRTLRHENLITVYDVGEADHQPFVAMEYVEGMSLSEMIRSRRPLSLHEKLGYVEQICSGLHFAHSHGVVHRDIKPANVMVDRRDVIRILDFGIARAAGSGLEPDGLIIGTLNYMSPEQMRGGQVDHRSDIFAVGAVAYELLTYRQAFPGSIDDGVMNRVMHEDPPPLSESAPGLPPQVEVVVRRLLAKRAEDRFPDLDKARAALRDIRRTLDPEVVSEAFVAAKPQALPQTGAHTPSLPAPVAVPTRPPPPSAGPGPVRPKGFGAGIGLLLESLVRAVRRERAPTAPPAPASDQPGPGTPAKIVDAHFAAFAPACVARQKPFVLEVWAYVSEQETAVWTLALRDGTASPRGTKGPVPLAIGTPLTVVVVAPGFDVEPPADSVVWKGDKANASFLLTARADVADGPCAGTAKIMSGSIPIAFLHFQLRVGSSRLDKTRLEATEQAIRTVFASYASADRAEVLQWARGAEVAGVDVFLDVLKLRESDRWETELMQQVPAKDLFCLFWSEPASKSPWVEREWRYALAARGLDYVHPVPLADPRTLPPPRELQEKHFGGTLFLLQQYEKLVKRQQQA